MILKQKERTKKSYGFKLLKELLQNYYKFITSKNEMCNIKVNET